MCCWNCTRISPFISSGLFCLNSLDRSFPVEECLVSFLLLPCFTDVLVFNVNNVNTDRTPRSAASELGLHCLQIFLLCNAGHKWVKNEI